MKKQKHAEADNGPVRAIAGIKGNSEPQRRVACSRSVTARPLGWRPLSGCQVILGRAKCPFVPKISLYSLRPADAGTGTFPGASSDFGRYCRALIPCLPAFVCRQAA